MRIANISNCLKPYPQWAREHAYGFIYWTVFLLVLEPGNVLDAIASGQPLAFDQEALRITVGALLGASATPLLLSLTRRFPLLGLNRWRNVSIHGVSAVGVAFALIVVSCFLVAWGLQEKILPSMAYIHNQLMNNWLLLIYAISAFVAIAHVASSLPAVQPQVRTEPVKSLTRIPVKTRGKLTYLDIASIDWIETQENYLALHVGSATHLIRETLKGMESQLDASRFVRIHRRAIVAVDRICEMRPVANGDSILRLKSGCEIRVSRRYREAVRERWPGSDSG